MRERRNWLVVESGGPSIPPSALCEGQMRNDEAPGPGSGTNADTADRSDALAPDSGPSATTDETVVPSSAGEPETLHLPPEEKRSGPVPVDTTRFGDYELLEEIARGGMGVVYKARQRGLNRVVALKMILSGQFAGEEDIQRFHAEAQSAANLDHPGIVPVFQVGEIGGQHFFSMGFVDGPSLGQKLREGVYAPREAAVVVREVAEAIAYAHDRKVIHRDLKPSNILIGTDGRARVTDFGLAKSVEGGSGVTVSGQILGTPSYMPPEQAAGKVHEVDARSDPLLPRPRAAPRPVGQRDGAAAAGRGDAAGLAAAVEPGGRSRA